MAALVSTIEIARPQDEVFCYVTDPATFAEWQQGVVSGSVEAGDTPALGSKCTTTRRIGGSERPSTSEITDARSTHQLGRSRDRRPDQSDRQRHRRAGQRERPVARDDRARFRGTRHRQAARAARRPPAGPQRDAGEHGEAQGAPRGESEPWSIAGRPAQQIAPVTAAPTPNASALTRMAVRQPERGTGRGSSTHTADWVDGQRRRALGPGLCRECADRGQLVRAGAALVAGDDRGIGDAARRADRVDVGGGASRLAAELLDRGHSDITVVDVSGEALESAREDFAGADRITWVLADVRSHDFGRRFALWHDRAVFHFMVAPDDRRAYLESART